MGMHGGSVGIRIYIFTSGFSQRDSLRRDGTDSITRRSSSVVGCKLVFRNIKWKWTVVCRHPSHRHTLTKRHANLQHHHAPQLNHFSTELLDQKYSGMTGMHHPAPVTFRLMTELLFRRQLNIAEIIGLPRPDFERKGSRFWIGVLFL